MGGKAFLGDHPGLRFPRLPPKLYERLKDTVTGQLLHVFEHAQVPIEAPEKGSHGDIDVLVCNPISHSNTAKPADPAELVSPARLAQVLGARLWKQQKGSATINFAFELPEGDEADDSSSSSSTAPQASTTTDIADGTPSPTVRMFQVDVCVCENAKSLRWMLFSHAHGDLWNILGSIIRPFSLVKTQWGFLIVIDEFAEKPSATAAVDGGGGGINAISRNLQRVLVTDDPDSVVGFLGLDPPARYWQPFDSVEQMFDFAATCRFYAASSKQGGGGAKGEETTDGKADGCGGRGDRRKAKERPIFKLWLTAYVPAHPPRQVHDAPDVAEQVPVVGSSTSASKARASKTAQEAKLFFGPSFGTKYTRARDRSLLIHGSARLWADIRHTLTAELGVRGAALGYAMKGLKRCIQPQGFDAWVQAVLARGEREIIDPSDPSECMTTTTTTQTDDDLGFHVPGIAAVRRHFRACEFDKVKDWVFGSCSDGGGNACTSTDSDRHMWSLVSRLQREEDSAESRLKRAATTASAE